MAKNNTTITASSIVEGKPMSREGYQKITLAIMDEWIKINHPEIKKEWLDICQNEQVPKKVKIEKLDKDGKPLVKTIKHRNGTTSTAPVYEVIAAPKGTKKRLLTVFEIRDWFGDKFDIKPVEKGTVEKKRDSIGNW